MDMRRRNGWGDETVSYLLPEPAIGYLAAHAGPGNEIAEASFSDLVRRVPESRLRLIR